MHYFFFFSKEKNALFNLEFLKLMRMSMEGGVNESVYLHSEVQVERKYTSNKQELKTI